MNGTDPTPQDVSLEKGFFTKHQVKVFCYNQQVTDSLTDSIRQTALQAGVPVVGVYETMPVPGLRLPVVDDGRAQRHPEGHHHRRLHPAPVTVKTDPLAATGGPPLADRHRRGDDAADAVLRVEDVSVSLGGRRVLDRVSFSVEAGGFCGLIGSNGAGKTTLLRVILGLDRPERRPGRGGRRDPVTTEPADWLRPAEDRPRGGHAAAGPGPGRARPRRPPLRDLPTERAKRRIAVDEMLDAVGATRFADARIGTLSGGEQQRVMIAQALICRPKLLLLDEPLANLDIRSAAEVVDLLARIAAEQRIAILLSAHDMNPLLPVMDRVVYLADGRAASGTDRRGGPNRHPQPALRPPRRGDPRPGPGAGRLGRRASGPPSRRHRPVIAGGVMLVAASWSPAVRTGILLVRAGPRGSDRGCHRGGRVGDRGGVHGHPGTVVRRARPRRHRHRRRLRRVPGRCVHPLRVRRLQRGRRRRHGAHRHPQAPRPGPGHRHRARRLAGVGRPVPLRGHHLLEHHRGHRERAVRVHLHLCRPASRPSWPSSASPRWR